ncbi:hypothetical protein VOLCADRAFT_106206 [Volvox carteri f. nagariensis]|uniref:histidine kinase n=1 Tax=Volvox carteri f. nagariensis TaxID=3068 RepID=D8U5T7_VOLCA|nr:uncharacterized protein VOLCADRAFT_106206 [Volvox carteri f. nagariensis]EFJ44978.1 hypothetical protein VOLCADRAFT_106206 [Volvox carteri f. nagariensis]|eukprot:XP_002953949.1 hypothetical protein VOLCADRAFT_106206 [Volvox carteri f. nagariensis]
MESDVLGHQSRVVLKTVSRMPRTFISQLYAVDMAVTGWVSFGSLSYAACAIYLASQNVDRSCAAGIGEQVASVEWTFQVQTAAFGAVLLLNLLNLGMRQHLLPFKCNLLLLFINGVAFVTDLLLWRGATMVMFSSSGRPFAPLRYVQWCHSTPTMIYMLALLADCGGCQLAVPLLSDVLMVASGLAACYTRGFLKDAMTIVSFGTFIVVLYYVYGMFHKTLSSDVSPEQRSTLRTVLALLLALWSAFPVVWLAADWHLMGPQMEAICWGVCDYLAKVVFSSQLWQSNLTEVQLRRDRALEAWEASNRVEAVTRLTALLKQRDDLLSTLSHELRTPLAGIVALSESLCQEVSAALPSSAQNLATVRATATCMLNIVTSTLDSFAARRVGEPGGAPYVGDDGSGPVTPSVPLVALDLRPLVETVTTVLRPLAHDGVAIVSDLPSVLPLVAADSTRLSQVLYNLVGNAMRFTTHGEQYKRQRGRWRHLALRQTAIVPVLRVILVQCRQLPGWDAGLGLYLVRLALRAQGSDITAESAPGPHHQQQQVVLVEEVSNQTHQQQQSHADYESGSHAQLSGSGFDCGEARFSYPVSAVTTASDGSGAERVSAAPSSPKPTVPSSPKPWVACATARLVKLSAGAAAAGSRTGDGDGESGAAIASAGPQHPPTSAFLLGESPGPLHSRPLRMSLDEQRRNLLFPQHKQPSSASASAGSRCKASCTAECCGREPPAQGAAVLGVASKAAASTDILSAVADAGLGVAVPQVTTVPPLRLVTPTLTPAPTPTAAMTRNSTGNVMSSLTPFDVAHAMEEGRQLARSGLRPNFRHRNNGTLQVLSVDDDPINQLVAGQMLTSQSWKVVKCMNGPEALAHLQLAPKPGTVAAAAAAASASVSEQPVMGASASAAASLAAAAAAAQPLLLPAVLPDCVLLDVMMPGMSGFEVCRKMREHFSSAQLPIIIVSAKGDSAAVDEAFESGADDYMTKPYKRTEMVSRIKAQIRTRDSILDAAARAAAAAAMLPAQPAQELSPPAPITSGSTTTAWTGLGTGGTPRACCSSAAARMLPACSGAASEVPSPSPSPLHQVAHQGPHLDARPTSVDVFLLQQPTPNVIKMRMGASRGGLDGSWGRVGLYKRDGMLSRTGLVEGTVTPWDAGLREGPLKDPVTAPAIVLGSPMIDLQPVEGSLTGAAGVSASAGAPGSSSDTIHKQVVEPLAPAAGLAEAAAAEVGVAIGMSKPPEALPEATMVEPAKELASTANTPGLCLAGGQSPAATSGTGRCSSDAGSVTAAGIVAALVDVATASGASEGAVAEGAASSRGDGGSSSGCRGCGDGGEPSGAAALMREVLTEVRRSRVVEADIERLTSRVAALRTACCTLAAERDGWRRQARDLRALLAAGLGGAIAVPAVSMPVQAKARNSAQPHLALAEALAAAHGSRSSADSLGITGGGAPNGGAVAAQLEDLKKEAALLRQQLSMALASVGGNGSIALGGATDTGGSRNFGLPSSCFPAVRPQRGLLGAPRTSDSPHSAAITRVGATGDQDRSGGGGGNDGAPPWGVSVFPNTAYVPPPDIFLTTEASGLSAGSGPGGGACEGCASGEAGAGGCHAAGAAARHGKRALTRAASSGVAGAPGLVSRAGLAAAAEIAIAKHANGGGGGGAAAAGGSVGKEDNAAAPVRASGDGTSDAAVALALPQLPKGDTAQVLGELRGSSVASEGGRRATASTSAGDEMCRVSSTARAPVVQASSSRGSRSKGGGGGVAGTSGILRLLCSKGAAPTGSSPNVSPHRRNPHHQQQQQ